MQNLKPRRRRAAGARLRLTVLVAGLAAAGGLWWLGLPGSDRAAAAPPAGTAIAARASVAAAGQAPAPSAAVIVDEPSSAGASPAEATPSTAHADPAGSAINPFAPASGPGTQATPPAVAAKPAPANGRVRPSGNPARTATRNRSAAAPARASARATPDTAERDLLTTLLGNINRASPAVVAPLPRSTDASTSTLKRPRRGSDPDALDALVRQVRERDVAAQVAGAAAVGATGSLPGDGAAATPSAPLQVQLRQCPRANTTAGLRCRQKLCAKLTGSDPACPRG